MSGYARYRRDPGSPGSELEVTDMFREGFSSRPVLHAAALLVLGCGIGFSSAGGGHVGPVKKTVLITIPVQIDIGGTSPEQVWSLVTSYRGFGTLTGFKIEDPQGAFTRLGATVKAQVWEDKGTLIVTGLDPGKELRVTWEPATGNYLCAKRIVVSGYGAESGSSGARLEYWDRYTDDQPNADETANQVRDETGKALLAFTALLAGP